MLKLQIQHKCIHDDNDTEKKIIQIIQKVQNVEQVQKVQHPFVI